MKEKSKYEIKGDSNFKKYTKKFDLSMGTRPSENIQIETELIEENSFFFLKQNLLTDLQATVYLMKVLLGAGIFSLAYIFSKNGCITSSLYILIIGAFSLKTTNYMIAISGEFYGTNNITISNMISISSGNRVFYFIFSFCLFLFQFGKTLANLMIFINVFEIFFVQTFGLKFRLFSIIASISFVFPSIFIIKWNKFYIYSFIGLVIILPILIIFSIFAFLQLDKNFNHINFSTFFNDNKFFETFGLIYFRFSNLGAIYPIRNSMNKQENFPEILKRTTILFIFLLIIFGNIFVLQIPNSKINIILSLMPYTKFIIILCLFYAFCAGFNYCIDFLNCMMFIEDLKIMKNNSKILFYLLRFVIAAIILTTSFYVPNFLTVAKYFGIGLGTFTQFLFPILLYHNVYKKNLSLFEEIQMVIMIIFVVATSLLCLL